MDIGDEVQVTGGVYSGYVGTVCGPRIHGDKSDRWPVSLVRVGVPGGDLEYRVVIASGWLRLTPPLGKRCVDDNQC